MAGISYNRKPYDTVEELNYDFDFAASSGEDVTITMEREFRELVRGRLYIDEDPGTGSFDMWATYSFYSRNRMFGEDAFIRTDGLLTYTELASGTTGSDTNLVTNNPNELSPNDLIVVLGSPDPNEFGRISVAGSPTTTMEDNISGVYPIGTGVARVSEFNGFALFNNEAGNNAYTRVIFGSGVTLSLKMDLMVKKQ